MEQMLILGYFGNEKPQLREDNPCLIPVTPIGTEVKLVNLADYSLV